jgi:CheY-like chemotaxis protein
MNVSVGGLNSLVSPQGHSPSNFMSPSSAFGDQMSAEKLLSAYQEVSKTQMDVMNNMSKHVQEGVALMQNPPGTEKETSWTKTPNILLVEDDPICRSLSSKILSIFGCEYALAGNGKEALEMFKVNRYDLILMDISMPQMDGITATLMIRKQDGSIPIVAMTSSVTEEDCMKYLSHGFNDILAKPFSKESLWQTLMTWLSRLKAP